jgi:hypothetical protein
MFIVLEKVFALELLIEDCVEHDRHCSVEDVEELVDERIIGSLSREVVVDRKPKLGEDEHNVLEEVVEHQRRVLSVTLASVHKQQWSQHLELAHRIVACPCCLLSLHTLDSDTHMSRCDHAHVVGTVPD